jgi:hypothetical protein
MSVAWSLVESTAQWLERDQREAVLGDLVEAGENAWQSLLGVLSLVFRKEAALWTSWRPWLAGFGLSLPASFLLMGASLSVAQTGQRFFSPQMIARPGIFTLIAQALLFIGWSWSGGYVVGFLSRRTLWVSAVLSFSPCVFCLDRFRVPSLSRFCLLLFLLPAVWGVWQGARKIRFRQSSPLIFALLLTVLMIAPWRTESHLWWSPQAWVFGAILGWPVWYLVVVCRSNPAA